MPIFLDTANSKALQKGLEFGTIDGGTTHPRLIPGKKREFFPMVMKPFLENWEKAKT
jgi:transaldolase